MSKEIKTNYCIVGTGIAGVLLASKLASAGKKIVMLDQGPRFTGADRATMLQQSKTTLNDFADYNDGLLPTVVTPHTSAPPGKNVAGWTNWRLLGVGDTSLHYEGLMIRPLKEDLKVKFNEV